VINFSLTALGKKKKERYKRKRAVTSHAFHPKAWFVIVISGRSSGLGRFNTFPSLPDSGSLLKLLSNLKEPLQLRG